MSNDSRYFAVNFMPDASHCSAHTLTCVGTYGTCTMLRAIGSPVQPRPIIVLSRDNPTHLQSAVSAQTQLLSATLGSERHPRRLTWNPGSNFEDLGQ